MYKDIYNWSARVWRWLAEGKFVWLILLWITAIAIYGSIVWCSEFSIRLTGYSYQMIGILLAFIEIKRIADHFEHPQFKILFIDWLKRFPKWKQNTVINAKAASYVTVGGKAYGEVWQNDNPDQPIEERFNAVLNNLDKIRKVQREHTKTIDKIEDNLEQHNKELSEQAEKIEKEIKSDLESLHTGDLLMSLAGLLLLAIGISISTFSQEFSLMICE